MTAAFVPSSFAAERSVRAAVMHQLSMLPSSATPLLSLQEEWTTTAATTTVATITAPSSSLLLSDGATSFDPILPDTSTLIGMGIIVVLCVVASSVWSNDVVPVSRSKLAISKSRGEVKEYLEELKEDGGKERGAEQWLFTDWLQENKSRKAPAIPLLKKAKWNSGDNPVVVTCAMMLVGVVVASLTERGF